MDRKNLTLDEFETFINSETIAYHVYDVIKRNVFYGKECVDILAMTYLDCDEKNIDIPTLYKTKLLLQKEYDIDMYSLSFRYEDIKLKIKRYDLVKQLEKYFQEKNIKYNPDKVFYKGQELSSLDPTIEYLMDQINDIDMDLIMLDDKSSIGI